MRWLAKSRMPAMPLTSLQCRLLGIIAKNRTPDSYVAGGSVINAEGIRYSADLDLFSDRIETLSIAGLGLWVDAGGRPDQPGFTRPEPAARRIHEGRRGGAWPSSSEISGAMIQDVVEPRGDGGDHEPGGGA